MGKKCNRDCFNCVFDDCIIDKMTKEEREEAKERDKNYANFGLVYHSRKPRKAKYRNNAI